MDEKLPPPSPEEQEATLETERITRRTFMMNVGIALNAAVALAIATPVVAYLLGPVTRRKEYRHWIDIGNTADFQPGETRLITYRQSIHRLVGWRNRQDPGVCALHRRRGSSSSSPSTAPTSAARCAGSPSRNSLCAPATAASTTPMAAAPPARRNAASSPMK